MTTPLTVTVILNVRFRCNLHTLSYTGTASIVFPVKHLVILDRDLLEDVCYSAQLCSLTQTTKTCTSLTHGRVVCFSFIC